MEDTAAQHFRPAAAGRTLTQKRKAGREHKRAAAVVEGADEDRA